MTKLFISNTDDIINSLDVIARIKKLQDDRDALNTEIEKAQEVYDAAFERSDETLPMAGDALNMVREKLEQWCREDARELNLLEALAEEAEGCAANWQHGESLIRDSYFITYAQDVAYDIGGIAAELSVWPLNCIDWVKATKQLQADHSSVEFGDVVYWVT